MRARHADVVTECLGEGVCERVTLPLTILTDWKESWDVASSVRYIITTVGCVR